MFTKHPIAIPIQVLISQEAQENQKYDQETLTEKLHKTNSLLDKKIKNKK